MPKCWCDPMLLSRIPVHVNVRAWQQLPDDQDAVRATRCKASKAHQRCQFLVASILADTDASVPMLHMLSWRLTRSSCSWNWWRATIGADDRCKGSRGSNGNRGRWHEARSRRRGRLQRGALHSAKGSQYCELHEQRRSPLASACVFLGGQHAMEAEP